MRNCVTVGIHTRKESRDQKLLESSSLPPTPKGPKISGEIRQNRIIELEDRIKDLNDTLMYKEKRREKACNVHNYKECDELTANIGG